MMVLPPGVVVAVVAIVTLAGFPTTTAGIVSGVVVVVVVVTERVGVGGGSAETMRDSGSETQPARRLRAPQHAKIGVSCLTARAEAERDSRIIIFDFIFREYPRTGSDTMGYNPTVDGNIKFLTLRRELGVFTPSPGSPWPTPTEFLQLQTLATDGAQPLPIQILPSKSRIIRITKRKPTPPLG